MRGLVPPRSRSSSSSSSSSFSSSFSFSTLPRRSSQTRAHRKRWKAMSHPHAMGRRILRTRTAHPYHPARRIGMVGNRCVGSVISGLRCAQALKKVRRPCGSENAGIGSTCPSACQSRDSVLECGGRDARRKPASATPLWLRLRVAQWLQPAVPQAKAASRQGLPPQSKTLCASVINSAPHTTCYLGAPLCRALLCISGPKVR
jgi:hypothetical protein